MPSKITCCPHCKKEILNIENGKSVFFFADRTSGRYLANKSWADGLDLEHIPFDYEHIKQDFLLQPIDPDVQESIMFCETLDDIKAKYKMLVDGDPRLKSHDIGFFELDLINEKINRVEN